MAKVNNQPILKLGVHTTCHNCSTSSSNISQDGSAHGLIAHVQQEATTKPPKQYNSVELINITMSSCLPKHQKSKPVEQQVFPDSGASLCLASFKHISPMNLSLSDLIPYSQRVTAIGGSTIHYTHWLPIKFTINGNSSKEPIFVCDGVNHIYLGCQAYMDLRILHQCYPYPMFTIEEKSEVQKVDLVLSE